LTRSARAIHRFPASPPGGRGVKGGLVQRELAERYVGSVKQPNGVGEVTGLQVRNPQHPRSIPFDDGQA
jgi:hypothetical protein